MSACSKPLSALIATLLCGAAVADTLTLTNGATVDGKVKQRSDGLYEVDAGGNIVVYRPEEVVQLESNDRDGYLNLDEVREQVRLEQERLATETGLTQEQRDRVDDLLNRLQSGSAAERLEARERLVKLNQEVSVIKYLKYWFTNLITPALLEAIFYVAPADCLDELHRGVTHENYECRSKAIDLLATMGHADSADLIARGLIDHAFDVQLSAIYALAKLGSKESSTALLEMMAKPDVKLGNASQQALEALWKNELEGQTVPKSVTEWKDFLSKSRFQGGYTITELEPLILPEEEFVYG